MGGGPGGVRSTIVRPRAPRRRLHDDGHGDSGLPRQRSEVDAVRDGSAGAGQQDVPAGRDPQRVRRAGERPLRLLRRPHGPRLRPEQVAGPDQQRRLVPDRLHRWAAAGDLMADQPPPRPGRRRGLRGPLRRHTQLRHDEAPRRDPGRGGRCRPGRHPRRRGLPGGRVHAVALDRRRPQRLRPAERFPGGRPLPDRGAPVGTSVVGARGRTYDVTLSSGQTVEQDVTMVCPTALTTTPKPETTPTSTPTGTESSLPADASSSTSGTTGPPDGTGTASPTGTG